MFRGFVEIFEGERIVGMMIGELDIETMGDSRHEAGLESSNERSTLFDGRETVLRTEVQRDLKERAVVRVEIVERVDARVDCLRYKRFEIGDEPFTFAINFGVEIDDVGDELSVGTSRIRWELFPYIGRIDINVGDGVLLL